MIDQQESLTTNPAMESGCESTNTDDIHEDIEERFADFSLYDL